MVRKLTKFETSNKVEENIVIILRGGTGVGKTTIAKLLAQKLKRSVHVEQDILRYMIVNGLVASRTSLQPGANPKEYQRQCRLGDKNTIDLTKNFLKAGFNVIIDGFNGGESGDIFYYLKNLNKIKWYPNEKYLKSELPGIKIFQVILDTKEKVLVERLRNVKNWDEEVISFILKQREIFLTSIKQAKIDLFIDTSESDVTKTVAMILSKIRNG